MIPIHEKFLVSLGQFLPGQAVREILLEGSHAGNIRVTLGPVEG